MRVQTDGCTDRLTDANPFNNLSHAICYRYGTDNEIGKQSYHFVVDDRQIYILLNVKITIIDDCEKAELRHRTDPIFTSKECGFRQLK